MGVRGLQRLVYGLVVAACAGCPPDADPTPPDAGRADALPARDGAALGVDGSAPAAPDAAIEPYPEIMPFDLESVRAAATCMQVEHVLLPRPAPPPGRRIGIACLPGMSIEESAPFSIVRDGAREVAWYSGSGARQIDLGGDGLVDLSASGLVETGRPRLSFASCSDQQTEALTAAFYAALGAGLECLGRANRVLAADFVRTIRLAVFDFACMELPSDRLADITPTIAQGVCNDGTAPHRVRVDMERIRRLGEADFARNLASTVFHEVLHTFVSTLATHTTDTISEDQVKACQTHCFPTPAWPSHPAAERCCADPGPYCGGPTVVGTAHWTLNSSTRLEETSRATCGPDHKGTAVGWYSSGCKWTFTREAGGQLMVHTSCQFRHGGETNGDRSHICNELPGSPCARWTEQSSSVQTAECQSTEPITLDDWPRVPLVRCLATDHQEVIEVRERTEWCGALRPRIRRGCNALDRVGGDLHSVIDVTRDGTSGTRTKTPLPCPNGVTCQEVDKIKWSFQGLGP